MSGHGVSSSLHARLARRDSRVAPYQRRHTARRHRARPAHPRAGRLLGEGPQLPRRRAAVSPASGGSVFVTRATSTFTCTRRYSRPVDRRTGVLCDQDVELTVFSSQPRDPARWRRRRDRDAAARIDGVRAVSSARAGRTSSHGSRSLCAAHVSSARPRTP
jgi:hypothetical protein